MRFTLFLVGGWVGKPIPAFEIVVDVLYLHFVFGGVCNLGGSDDCAAHNLYLLFIVVSTL